MGETVETWTWCRTHLKAEPIIHDPTVDCERVGPLNSEHEARRVGDLLDPPARGSWTTHRLPPVEMFPFEFEEFRSLGLLWLINATAFHPRGFAIEWAYPEEADFDAVNRGAIPPIGWRLSFDGSEPVVFDEELSNERFERVEQFFDWAKEIARGQ